MFGLLDIHAYFSCLFYFFIIVIYCLQIKLLEKLTLFTYCHIIYNFSCFISEISCNVTAIFRKYWLWNSKIFLSILIWYLAKCKYYNIGTIFHVNIPNTGQNIVNINNITLTLFCFQNFVFNFYFENLIIHVHPHVSFF